MPVYLIKPMANLLIKVIKVILYMIAGFFLIIALVIAGIMTPQITGNNTTPITQIDPPAYLLPLFVNAGAKYGIPWAFLATINRIETNYGSSASEVSSAGALGPMQFMPSTWQEYGKGSPFDYVNAVNASAKMFKQLGMKMSQMTGSQSAYYVALYSGSYNAGAGNWDNMSFQTINYRTQASAFYPTIKNSTIIPQALMKYWESLNSSQLEKMVNKKLSIYPKNYKGAKVKELTDLVQVVPKPLQKPAQELANSVSKINNA